MDAPKCRLCQKQHWQRETCGFNSGEKQATFSIGYNPPGCAECVKKDELVTKLRNHITDLEDEIFVLRSQPVTTPAPVTTGVTKAKRDRAAYMREYRAR